MFLSERFPAFTLKLNIEAAQTAIETNIHIAEAADTMYWNAKETQ